MKAQDFLAARLSEAPLPIDIQDANIVGFQVSHDSRRIWFCINGVCILRVKNVLPMAVEITDDRNNQDFVDTEPNENAHGL